MTDKDPHTNEAKDVQGSTGQSSPKTPEPQGGPGVGKANHPQQEHAQHGENDSGLDSTNPGAGRARANDVGSKVDATGIDDGGSSRFKNLLGTNRPLLAVIVALVGCVMLWLLGFVDQGLHQYASDWAVVPIFRDGGALAIVPDTLRYLFQAMIAILPLYLLFRMVETLFTDSEVNRSVHERLSKPFPLDLHEQQTSLPTAAHTLRVASAAVVAAASLSGIAGYTITNNIRHTIESNKSEVLSRVKTTVDETVSGRLSSLENETRDLKNRTDGLILYVIRSSSSHQESLDDTFRRTEVLQEATRDALDRGLSGQWLAVKQVDRRLGAQKDAVEGLASSVETLEGSLDTKLDAAQQATVALAQVGKAVEALETEADLARHEAWKQADLRTKTRDVPLFSRVGSSLAGNAGHYVTLHDASSPKEAAARLCTAMVREGCTESNLRVVRQDELSTWLTCEALPTRSGMLKVAAVVSALDDGSTELSLYSASSQKDGDDEVDRKARRLRRAIVEEFELLQFAPPTDQGALATPAKCKLSDTISNRDKSTQTSAILPPDDSGDDRTLTQLLGQTANGRGIGEAAPSIDTAPSPN